ncbi:Aste57867_13406 [Aphanomyces stellatus]|uniref:Aste57867_13406 protein n=1 Tax=Aphanomyces stellatus TaxID=120398 RepID=A0A485KYS7_9STRA|nr:hypothetical protein As57867_013356 [Aphanomyces stellatus]VFT90245.1 Aste57867_13406 [Aphanomyces stellatus]
MAWGVKTGAADLVQRLQAGNTKNMYILSTRKVGSADSIALAAALESHPIMEEFYFSGHEIDAAGLAAFAKVLAKNTVLQKIAVGTSSLGDAGVALLADGLGQNPASALVEWDMEFKGIGNAGAASMGAMFASNHSLRRVNVSRNIFDAAGLDAIFDGLRSSSVERLDLHDSNLMLGPGAAAYVEDPSCRLQTFLLTGNPLGTSAAPFCAALGRNASLTTLNLSQCDLSDDVWVALGQALGTNTTLTTLDLSHNAISNAATAAAFLDGLGRNHSLHYLSLAHTGLVDDQVPHLAAQLAANGRVTSLDVSGNGLSHASLQALLGIATLTQLRFFNNAVGAGIAHVIEAIRANTTVQVLDLGANSLHGPLAATVFEALHGHASLQTLEMGGNDLGEVGLAALDRLKAANPTLDVAMDKNAGGDDETM